jgi:hypothetical protein
MIIEVIGSISFLIIALLITCELQKYASNTITLLNPLQDILHRPELLFLIKYYNISDYVIGFYITTLVLFFNNYIHIFLYQLSILYLLRSISFSITLLPKCGKMKDKDNTRSSFRMLFDYLILRDTHTGHNNDLLFSGHSCFMLLYTLHVGKYYTFPPQTIIYLLHIVNGIMSMLNIVSRCHYSIDILYAYITTIFIFQNF